ncbi:MAG: META domain-containing protein [Flavobacteriales bacterium]|jgi:heat shock protein HslJ|nr:META domain-containing protein [Flavobacteriales bacterium]
MKTTSIALLLLITLTANKCVNKAGPDLAAMKEKKWVVETLNGLRPELPDGAERPWLKLAGDQLQGFGGCNSLMGSYVLDGEKLSFSGIGSTKKYCEGIQPTENAVKEMLGKVDSFKLDGDQLRLLGSGKELAALRGE